MSKELKLSELYYQDCLGVNDCPFGSGYADFCDLMMDEFIEAAYKLAEDETRE